MPDKETCQGCGNHVNDRQYVPLAMVELHNSAMERTIKRLWIIIIILIGLLCATNFAWLVYESQFEEVTTTEVTQENDKGYNNYIGNDGDIVYGSTDNQEDNNPEAQNGR